MELQHLGKQELFECPACFKHQHSVHVDGNKKLYRYSKVQRCWLLNVVLYVCQAVFSTRGVRKSYYNNQFIVDNSDVDAHISLLGYQDESVFFCTLILYIHT